jgi:hypothetical protein
MDYLIETAHAAAEHLNQVRAKPKFDIRAFHIVHEGRRIEVEYNGDLFDLPDAKVAQVTRAEAVINEALHKVGTLAASVCPETGRISIAGA